MTIEVGSGHKAAPAAAMPGRLLIVLGALSAFGPVTTDVYLPSLPAAAAALNTTPAGIQSSLTVCLLGLAAGQLIAGPLSDSRGRRGLLLIAMVMFVVTSALCAIAANIVTLDLFRLFQGGAGGAGIAICFAIVRDLCAGSAAARAYSILLAVSLLALIVAPTIGGQLLRITDWRGVFLTLAGLGLIFLCCAYHWVAETLPLARRTSGGFTVTSLALRRLAADPGFTGYALIGGFSFAALFAYISAAPFIFEGRYHVSPQQFALFLALNGAGLVLANTLNARLLRRFSPLELLDLGLLGVTVGAVGVLVALATNQHHLYTLMAPLFLMVSSYGLTRPNSAALALDRHPNAAGSAAALFGLILFALGALAAPITGLDRHSATPLGATVVAAALLAVLARIMTGRDTARIVSAVDRTDRAR
jgi:MFS transporter, DHA1 family, multidrug resistance protein